MIDGCREAALGRAGRPRLLAVLPRGEAVRNFVWNGGLDPASKVFDVSLLSVRPSDEVWADLELRFETVLELRQDPTPKVAALVRELLRNAHNEALGNGAARYRIRSHRSNAGSGVARMKVEAWRIAGRAASSSATLEWLTRRERAVSRRLDRSTFAPRILDELDPQVVLNTSEVHSENSVATMQVAGWRGLPTATFLFSWDNLTSQRRLLVPADRYLVWNQDIADDLVRMYPAIGAERVVVTGTPQFDPHFDPGNIWSREELCGRIGVDPGREILLYTTGMPNHMPGEPYLVEAIADGIAERFGSDGPQLVVRVYAKDRTGRFDDLVSRRRDIAFADPLWEREWLTPLPSDTPLWSSLLAHCDVGVNVASTVTLELCMFDKPVINVAFNPPGVPEYPVRYADYYDFDHYRPVATSGAVDLAGSLDEVIAQVEGAVRRPEARAAARRALVEQMFGDTLDGRAGVRISTVLEEIR